MKQLKITTTASATVTLDGLDINDVIKKAADLAHEVLEELSVYRQRNDFSLTFTELTDWLNAHHLDYRGLIDKGLAIEVPKDIYN